MKIDASILHVRPRFQFKVPLAKKELLQRISDLAIVHHKKIKSKVREQHVTLDILKKERHFWSPQLNFRIEEENANETYIIGLIGPRPNVWTLFVFIYFLIGVLGFMISSFCIAKFMIGGNSNYLLSIPITLGLLLSVYLTSKYGETLGKDQIELLKQFIRDTVAT